MIEMVLVFGIAYIRQMNLTRNPILFILLAIIPGFLDAQQKQYTLEDFFQYNPELEHKVDELFQSMSDSQRVAQMIFTVGGELGKSNSTVEGLVKDEIVGGVLCLKNSREGHKALIASINQITAKNKQIPQIFAIDAEPTLFSGRIRGASPVKNTNQLTNQADVKATSDLINKELNELGFHLNFAPVVDVSKNSDFISKRSFGSNTDSVAKWSSAYIRHTQNAGIAATAKHFPGHGFVKGDTHKESVYIDGEMQELSVYPPLIDQGVLAIMIGHINVRNHPKYDTEGLPATCSRKVVTDLLKEELDFRGLIITDALNLMKAVTKVEDAPLLASKAGCDILLMPKDERQVHAKIVQEIKTDDNYRRQVYISVKKILRLKICLGLI